MEMKMVFQSNEKTTAVNLDWESYFSLGAWPMFGFIPELTEYTFTFAAEQHYVDYRNQRQKPVQGYSEGNHSWARVVGSGRRNTGWYRHVRHYLALDRRAEHQGRR